MKLTFGLSRALLSLFVVVAVGLASPAFGGRWTEEDFWRKGQLTHPYVVVESRDVALAKSVIGSTRRYQAHQGDTFLDLARYYGLGYNEIEQANPGVDPWIPPEGQALVLPTEWVLPHVDYRGVVVNIPEMRLYFFHPRQGSGPQLVTTYPVGLGRDEWRTPQGAFKIRGKTLNPTWNIPESIQKERVEKYGFSEKSIPGGSPDNPLGKHRIELTLPMYGIHGTNIPWGVGMQVSHGCIRLYPEDIEQLFPIVEVGMPGQFVYQPVKVGARDGRIYVAAHPDIYRLTPGLFREAQRILDELGWTRYVDLGRVERAVQEQSGVPLDVTADTAPRDLVEEDLRPVSQTGSPPGAPKQLGSGLRPSS